MQASSDSITAINAVVDIARIAILEAQEGAKARVDSGYWQHWGEVLQRDMREWGEKNLAGDQLEEFLQLLNER